ncbi:MAG: hypothetical protein AB8U25_07390 [Rickettsiales endosymbiont of Dermacentor nuttalli]
MLKNRSALEIKGTIIHEMTHQLMDILFNNFQNPYSLDDFLHAEKLEGAIRNLFGI